MGFSLPMDNFKNMSVKIKVVTKQLPKYSRTTEEIIPFLDAWLAGQEERFIRKVKKIFEGAAVDKRYSIMDPIEVFTKTSFEERNDIYVREVIDLGEKVLEKALKSELESQRFRLHHYGKLHWNYDSILGCVFN